RARGGTLLRWRTLGLPQSCSSNNRVIERMARPSSLSASEMKRGLPWKKKSEQLPELRSLRAPDDCDQPF
ncbi:MAG TPA: hypothetical protein VEN29_04285, partial [Casimicrobiaceae bacterium]|nr:hypothetical protein [Casimicrobiaceae bacterium]